MIVIVLAAASLPFAFNERNGALGEGIYTNDQAAQLYWTDWLQHGVGPEPNAVRFGYPTGPQSVAAAAAEATEPACSSAFNGLLLAIPVARPRWRPWRRSAGSRRRAAWSRRR